MSNYYNEIDPFAAQWLRNLIAAGCLPAGEVDERSIVDVQPEDLKGFTQCHFFAGIGGWPLALKLAGWPDDRPVWTGSCPCQILSTAARGRNNAADLWPAWLALITASRPREILGEQVASKREWFDRACDDLEPLGYEIGAAVLPAVSVGQDHERQRVFFAAHANRDREPSGAVNGEMAVMSRARGHTGDMVRSDGLPSSVATMRAFGNAIVPQVAAAFIEAFLATPLPYRL